MFGKVLDIDLSCPLPAQLEQAGDGPVIVIVIVVAPGGITQEYMGSWQKESAFMRDQPGFLSARLYVGVGESNVTTTVAVWESADALKAAFANPGWQKALGLMPQNATAYPVLVRKVTVRECPELTRPPTAGPAPPPGRRPVTGRVPPRPPAGGRSRPRPRCGRGDRRRRRRHARFIPRQPERTVPACGSGRFPARRPRQARPPRPGSCPPQGAAVPSQVAELTLVAGVLADRGIHWIEKLARRD